MFNQFTPLQIALVVLMSIALVLYAGLLIYMAYMIIKDKMERRKSEIQNLND